ncbi:MAG: hypothetical protein B6229_10160 [Spirochaetaceae bacterium 4572_7]|nr:MAG: hypothetical protein B6229_10160 [Spirochaetaceae bacterium 4572_7]
MPKLRMKTVLGFGIGDLGGNLYFSMIGFIFIFYLTEKMGLSGTLAGMAMMIGKLWDAITDPIVSTISDRSTSKFGRRRPFIFWGALLLAISMVLMFSLPKFESTLTTFIVVTALFALLSTAYTFVNIPYASMQPELTDDYDDKTRLTSFRMGFAILGTLLAVTARPIAESFGLKRNGWTFMAIIMGSIMLISSWITVFTVKEKPASSYKEQKGIKESYFEAFKNREFILALIPWTLFVSGVTIIQGAFLYYFKYLFGNQGLFELTIFGLIIIALISLPLWVRISQKISKGRSYMIGMGIIPDVVELDSARTGIRREGVYYSIWNFVMKSGQAIAGLIIGVTLDLFGFIPPASNGDVVVQKLLLLLELSF